MAATHRALPRSDAGNRLNQRGAGRSSWRSADGIQREGCRPKCIARRRRVTRTAARKSARWCRRLARTRTSSPPAGRRTRAQIFYEDPEYSFCILAHVYQDAKERAARHGPTWAIYGQAMADGDETGTSSPRRAGAARQGAPALSIHADPGTAYVYNREIAFLAPRRPTRLIRIEGRDVPRSPLCLRAWRNRPGAHRAPCR